MKNLIDVSVKSSKGSFFERLPNKIKVSMICMIAILLNGVSGKAIAGDMLTDANIPFRNGVAEYVQADNDGLNIIYGAGNTIFRSKKFDGIQQIPYVPSTKPKKESLANLPIIIYQTISSVYGNRRHPLSGKIKKHRGIDIRLPRGTNINPVANGVVIFSGWENGFGNVVKIDHGNGYISLYAHNTRNSVKVGQQVSRETVIGTVGATGWATGPHIHLEILLNGKNVDPAQFIRTELANVTQ